MKTIKQILLIGVIFSMTAFCVFAQSGTRCDDPLVAKLGDNLFSTVGEEVRWYTYEATRDGKITIASCEQTTDDTQVKIYTGSICEPVSIPIESDNSCGTQSKVAFMATQGNDYLIVWTNKSSSANFNWTLSEADWSPGEICSNPKQAVASNVNVCDHSNGTDQWFVYNAPGNGTITISSCGFTNLNTQVEIYDDCAGAVKAINDDNCDSQQSSVTFDCLYGTEYLIVWENVDASASYNWSLSFDGVPTHVDGELLERIMVSPNPTTGILTLKNLNIHEYVKVTLNDLSGTLLATFNVNEANKSFDISEFPNGVYVLTLSANDRREVLKIVKK